jgi:hypothetical protein
LEGVGQSLADTHWAQLPAPSQTVHLQVGHGEVQSVQGVPAGAGW